MSELKLTIEDNYLHAFLNMLQSLNYVSVEQVTPSSKKKQKNKLDNLAKNHPLREAIKPIRPFVSLQDLAKEQNYTKTDWQALDKIVDDMDIQEPLELLLEQLKSNTSKLQDATARQAGWGKDLFSYVAPDFDETLILT